jgi:hypothetical protein
MIIEVQKLLQSGVARDLFHPWRENRILRDRIDRLVMDLADISIENREYRKGLGKDAHVMRAEANAQYWSRRWTMLNNFVRQNCSKCGHCADFPKDEPIQKHHDASQDASDLKDRG